MQQKKTKLDGFIEAYASYDLQKEAKDVISSHVQFLKACKTLKAALVKHYGAYFAETFNGVKFQFINLSPVFCRVYARRANNAPTFAEKVETLSKIRADKLKTLTSRKAKLRAAYKGKLASSVASGIVLKVNGLLNAFEKACANLTFKPSREFFDTLSDVRETLNTVKFGKRETWHGFIIPDSRYLLSTQSMPIVSWLFSDSYKQVETCFTAISKFEKSSQVDKIADFDSIIDKLETSLCKRLHEDLAGKLITHASQTPAPNWLDSVDIKHVIRGEYVTADIGSENVPVKMLSAKEEVSRELAETDVRLSYSLESEACRTGIFAAIKGMTRELESGLVSATDKTGYLISFFNQNRGAYLQAYLDRAISKAIDGKGTADKSHLSDLNSLLASYSVVATPNNGESRVVGVLGASEIAHYVKFCCPWLSFKGNDGGWVESSKWEGPATAHKGSGFPVIGSDNVCLYPPITLHRYLTVKKSIQAQVRITNRARKRHNENLAKGK